MRGGRDLPQYLGCSDSLAQRLCDTDDDALFKRHAIPKKGGRGGTREVWEVRETEVAVVYRALSRRLHAFFVASFDGYPHRSSHAYLPGRSTLTNASAHQGASRLLHADIRNFFESISRCPVIALLRQLGVPEAAAEALATVVVRSDRLPLGLHTSPAIANALCHELDGRLAALVPAGRYTRYADDMTFSGPALPQMSSVAAELTRSGFALAEDKWRVVRAGRGLYVTGLSLEAGDRPRAPRDMKRRLRQDLHHAEARGLEHHVGRRGYPSLQSGINKIHGTIQYLRGIERELGDKLHARWIKILEDSGHTVSYTSTGTATQSDVLFLIDESVVDGPSGRLLALALVVVEDIEIARSGLSAFLEDRLAAALGTTAPSVLETEGLHWNELTPDDRTRVTECVRALPFRAFIAYGALPAQDPATYTSIYAKLPAAARWPPPLRPAPGDREGRGELEGQARDPGSTISASYQHLVSINSRRPVAAPDHDREEAL